jgi:hypothetical protein
MRINKEKLMLTIFSSTSGVLIEEWLTPHASSNGAYFREAIMLMGVGLDRPDPSGGPAPSGIMLIWSRCFIWPTNALICLDFRDTRPDPGPAYVCRLVPTVLS